MARQILPKKRFHYLTLCLLVLVAVTSSFVTTAGAAGLPKVDLTSSSIIADIAEASSPEVVWIETTYQDKQTYATPFRDFIQDTPSQGLGSGFFFDENGYILTNSHVIAGADTIDVILKDQKTPLRAKKIGEDAQLDVAIIKVDLPKKAPYLKFADSDAARIGDWVIAIGNPYGLDHTVTIGIISAKGRPIMASKGAGSSQSYDNMIQTDAAINPGNSGGPLLNLNGEVVGINTAVSSSGQGLGFAIPINTVKNILNELKTSGKVNRPWLGVNINDVKTLDANTRAYLGLNKTEGVVIRPLKGSPAAKAGLKAYDVVLEINHQQVSDTDDFMRLIQKQKIGDKITLLVMRNGDLITVEAVLAERPADN